MVEGNMGRGVIWDRQESHGRNVFLQKWLYALNNPSGRGLIEVNTRNNQHIVLLRRKVSHITLTSGVTVHYLT